MVPVELGHIAHVAAWMRACDVAEIWASHHYTAQAALLEGVAVSTLAYTAMVDGEPVCIFGVAPRSLLTGEGLPWMLATDGLQQIERVLARMSKPVVEAMLDAYPMLGNWVDARNTRTIRWLKWLGFTVEPAAPFGAEQLPFHRFWRTA